MSVERRELTPGGDGWQENSDKKRRANFLLVICRICDILGGTPPMRTVLFALLAGFAVASLPFNAPGQVVISEFMASNASTLADEDGAFEDWIEIHNTGPGKIIQQIKRDPLRPHVPQKFGCALSECVAKFRNFRPNSRGNSTRLLHRFEPAKLSLVEYSLLAETKKQPVVTEQLGIGYEESGHGKQKLAAKPKAGESLEISRRHELVEFGVYRSEFELVDRLRQRLLEVKPAKRLQRRGHGRLKIRGGQV